LPSLLGVLMTTLFLWLAPTEELVDGFDLLERPEPWAPVGFPTGYPKAVADARQGSSVHVETVTAKVGEDLPGGKRPFGVGELVQREGAESTKVCLAKMGDENLHLGGAPPSGDPPAGPFTSLETEVVADSGKGLAMDTYPLVRQLGENLSRFHFHLRMTSE
jgi:hypothetical protein